MTDERIPLFRVMMADDAPVAAARVLASGFIGQGQIVDDFELALRAALNAPRDVLTVNSCTSAIDLALHLIGAGKGDSVVTTPMTCSATNTHLALRGIRIIWADVDPITGLIDPVDAGCKIDPDTVAIIAVDWAGRVCDYPALRSHGVPVIQDAAHAWLAERGGRQIAERGVGGDYICWSFQAIKALTTIDGGALLCPDDATTERARLLRWYGLDRRSSSDFRCAQDIVEAGYKYHMSDVSAAVGLANMAAARNGVQRAREVSEALTEALSGIPGIVLPPPDAGASWWLYTLIVEPSFHEGREMENVSLLKGYLAAHGIESSPVHRRNDAHTAFKNATGIYRYGLRGVNAFASRELAIPCGWWVDDSAIMRIARTVRDWAESRHNG
jgi:dTDP-4-amino-4,6-dideoxygalactose transaminase